MARKYHKEPIADGAADVLAEAASKLLSHVRSHRGGGDKITHFKVVIQTTGIESLWECPIPKRRARMEPDSAGDWCDADTATRLLAEARGRCRELESALSRSPYEQCREEQEAGNGPCGACAGCCAELQDRAEKAEAENAQLRDRLARLGGGESDE